MRYNLESRHSYKELFIDHRTMNVVLFLHTKGKDTKLITLNNCHSNVKKRQ